MTTITINNFSDATKAVERLMAISSRFELYPVYSDGVVEESDELTFGIEEAHEWYLFNNNTVTCRDAMADELLKLVEFYDKVIVAYVEFICGETFKVAFTKGPSKREGSEVAHASKDTKVNTNKGGSTMNKTTIYLINTKSSKKLNAFCEANADKYSFSAVDKANRSMQFVMFAGSYLDEALKTDIAKRIKFQSFRTQTPYRCMFLNLNTGKVVTLHNSQDLHNLDVSLKTASAERTYNTTAQNVLSETAQWLELASQLTHNIINADAWKYDRQNCLDKMNLYLSDKDFDAYNAGHLEPRMKANTYTFKEDQKFFDLTFKKGDNTYHEEDREREVYILTDLETLKNFCHVLTCSRYNIEFNDSVGNGGRVTREACQGIINYSELADRINESELRDEIVSKLSEGVITVEEVSELLGFTAEAEDSISYREF